MRDTHTRRSSALALAASALGLAFASPIAWANEAAERLTERLDPLENYQATFEQQILDGGGERLQSAWRNVALAPWHATLGSRCALYASRRLGW